MNRYMKILKKPSLLFATFGHRGFFNWMNDKQYLKLLYKIRTGQKLNLENPQTFNEKLQWLKLHDRRPEYTVMVDKYAVKKYVADEIGEQYIIPTLGVWERFDDIDFDKLPDQFVLKCTHDSGGLIICRDKSKLDFKAVKKKINRCLKHNYFWGCREWPYKNVKPRIIAESYMKCSDSPFLKDYKFFCFNGKVKFLYLSEGLENHNIARISYVTLDWKQADFYREDYKTFNKMPPKPINFDKMIKFAEIFSKDIPFLRVDFYEVNGKIYFGELTFYTGSGFTKFEPENADIKIGNLLKLPDKRLSYEKKN